MIFVEMAESTAKVKSVNCNGISAFALLSLLCQQKIKIIREHNKSWKRFWKLNVAQIFAALVYYEKKSSTVQNTRN